MRQRLGPKFERHGEEKMRLKIVSLRKPVKVSLYYYGTAEEFELHIQHETGVENLSGLSMEDLKVIRLSIDTFITSLEKKVGLTDDAPHAIMDEEDSEVSDLLSGTIIDGISDLLLLPSCDTVAKALHEYVVSRGLTEDKTFPNEFEKWERVSMDIELLNPHIHVYNTNEFAKTILDMEDNGVALELLRNALDFQDSGSLCN